MAEVLAQLDVQDSEHPDVSLSHETGWCLGAYPTGVVVWENVEVGDARHMKDVSRERMLELWIHLSKGEIATIEAEAWMPGYY
jgi:hypothetical protein